jgi:GntR family transcriptional regulator of vanillate catabolism
MSRTGTSTSQTMRALLGLRELVLSGAFVPGARLSELPLVERLGVSRTPVRLALARLEHEGLLRALPAGGYAVREFSQSDIADAVELRGVLEGTAARFAAERGATQRELRGLRTVSDEIAGIVHRADYESFERYVGLNERFHAKLLAMAMSPLLQRAIDGITALPFASPSAFVFSEAHLPESREILVVAHGQHCALIEAIELREGTRAEAIGRERRADQPADRHAPWRSPNTRTGRFADQPCGALGEQPPAATGGDSLAHEPGAASPSAARTAA